MRLKRLVIVAEMEDGQGLVADSAASPPWLQPTLTMTPRMGAERYSLFMDLGPPEVRDMEFVGTGFTTYRWVQNLADYFAPADAAREAQPELDPATPALPPGAP